MNINRELFGYAYDGLKRKKKSSIIVLLVLVTTFSFIVFSISILESMKQTNDNFRIDTYGEWYLNIVNCSSDDEAKIQGLEEINRYGKMNSLGYVATGEKAVHVGTIDAALIDIGRLKLSSGHWPESNDEIVMEEDTISALGYDYTLNQTIALNVIAVFEDDIIEIEKEYKLVGIVKEYTDIWNCDYRDFSEGLVGIIVSESEYELLSSEISDELATDAGNFCKSQIFIDVDEKNRDIVSEKLGKSISSDLSYILINKCLESQYQSDDSYSKYFVLIICITVVAIFFVYIIQIESMVHSYLIMRSIGMTKKQLLKMIVYETTIISVPAIILGGGVGTLLVYLILKLVMYGGSIPVILAIPIRKLLFSIIIWFATVIIARVAVYLLTMRVPLVGGMQFGKSNRRRVLYLRKISTYLICVLMGTVVIYTGVALQKPMDSRRFIADCPSYIIWSDEEAFLKPYIVQSIGNIPGVTQAYSFSEYNLKPNYDEENANPCLYAIDREDWSNVFDIESSVKNIDEFDSGESVVVCIPKEDKALYTVPDEIDVDAFYRGAELFSLTKVKVGGVLYIPFDLDARLLGGVYEPYSIICSKKFIEKNNIYDSTRIYIHSTYSDESALTDITLASYSAQNGLFLSNRREEYQAYYQECTQEMIMLMAVGGSICIILLLLYSSILSLEKKYELKKYIILRRIGMSKKQWKMQRIKRAIFRNIIAFVGGLVIYICILLLKNQGVSTIAIKFRGNYWLIIPSIIVAAIIFINTYMISNKE